MKSTIYCDVLDSQIPSQPITTKSIAVVRGILFTSGAAVIGYSCGVKFLFFLYFKSPIALERFKLPSILPSYDIVEPAFRILLFSDNK